MDLRNGNITVRELMQSPQAREILGREFPGVMGSPMFKLAQGMSLNKVIQRASRSVPKEKIASVITQLKGV